MNQDLEKFKRDLLKISEDLKNTVFDFKTVFRREGHHWVVCRARIGIDDDIMLCMMDWEEDDALKMFKFIKLEDLDDWEVME